MSVNQTAVMTHLYFAYGSNLYPGRMRSRVPSARPVASGVVTHRQLKFHKRGLDGSAKADAFRTGIGEHRVWGVVYEILRHEKATLDECESLGVGYDEAVVRVHLQGTPEKVTATLYEARPAAITDGISAFGWYLGYIEAGARAHGCPEEYLQHLATVAVCEDPDRRRAESHERLLKMGSPMTPRTGPLRFA